MAEMLKNLKKIGIIGLVPHIEETLEANLIFTNLEVADLNVNNEINMNQTHLDFSKIDFKCPYCGKDYNDINDKYVNRCNNNKSGITRITCECNNKFYMTYNYKSEAVSFKLIN